MRGIKLFIITLVVCIGVTFSSQGVTSFATTTKHKATISSSSVNKSGMSKAKVKSLQTGLKRLSYFKYKVDGVFGSKTKNAVIRFQKSNKLHADGIAGRKTMLKINQKLGAKTTTSKKVSSRSMSGSIAKLIKYAKRHLGVDYNFGSASASKFDCSGFTMYVFKKVGITLPHSAAAQAKYGTAVSKNNLKPGDLVFFETYKPGISHGGIYIGNGYFIHASSGAGHVTITSLSKSYYTQRYRGATRLL